MRTYTHDSPAVKAVTHWWRALHPDPENLQGRPGNRGARARLRRCSGVLDALLERETHELIVQVNEALAREPGNRSISGDSQTMGKVVVLALVLARVNPPGQTAARVPHFASALGLTKKGAAPKENDRPRMSPNRFGALLRSRRDEEAFTRSICRAVTHLDHAPFDIRRFINDMLTFDNQTRRRWMFEYYGTRLDEVGEAHATSHSDKEITA